MRVAFIGDSLTEGWPGESYLERLRELLPADELLNRGRAGDTIVGVELRMRSDGLDQVDLAFIWVGVNDAFMGGWSLPGVEGSGAQAGEPGLARLRAAYEHLLAFTLARAGQVVCVPPVLPDDGVEGPFRARVEEISVMMTDVIRGAARARLFDLRDDVVGAKREDPWAQLTIDGVHLSARGAQVVAAAFARVIAEVRSRRDGAGS